MRRSLLTRRAMGLGWFVLVLVGLPITSSLAAITVDPFANDVSPANPATWGWNTQAFIGQTAAGKLTVDGGSRIRSSYSYLGYQSGSTGTVTVKGARSTWDIDNGDLSIGYSGSGTLHIADGGVVTSDRNYLGYKSGSTGTVTVEGAGSTWDARRAVLIGYSGTGTLNIADGGMVNSSRNYLGYQSGSTGTVAVKGAGSIWNAGSELNIGDSGSGTLNIADGGSVTSNYVLIGCESGSTGTVTLEGVGSIWNTRYDLFIGYFGSGTLHIADGGAVSTGTLIASLSDLHGNGTLHANGIVADIDLVFDASNGLTQTLTFGSGGQLALDVDGTGDLAKVTKVQEVFVSPMASMSATKAAA